MNEENEGIIASLTKTIGNNWRLLLVGIIILAVALNSSWSDNDSTAENKNGTTPQAEESVQNEENKPEETTQDTENTENAIVNTTQAEEPETVITSTNENSIAQIAARGEGVTHLARRAIKEYLENTGESLSAEQKIYTEDYLAKKTGTKSLEIGEQVEFSNDLIEQGIEQAKGLSEKQIENLSKYVPLVNNLN